MADTSNIRIAIIGAGIAGLTAAIALQSQPHIDIQIYERASELREVGATIALGPNGLRILEKLGVDDALDDSVSFRNVSGQSMIYRLAIQWISRNAETRHTLTNSSGIGRLTRWSRSMYMKAKSSIGIVQPAFSGLTYKECW
jgi:2-polyprenyl-6-methoxyphenol hydroxylase-like FAD-dependent oxidoreductase